MFALLGEGSQTYIYKATSILQETLRRGDTKFYIKTRTLLPKPDLQDRISFIPMGLVHIFPCSLSHFPILIKFLSLLIQAQPAGAFCFSYCHPIAGVERKRISKSLDYDLVLRSNTGKRVQLRECQVLILH